MATDQRPSVLNEIRAWVLVALAIGVHTVGLTWWGATLTTKVDYLTELSRSNNVINREMELRIRELERQMASLRTP